MQSGQIPLSAGVGLSSKLSTLTVVIGKSAVVSRKYPTIGYIYYYDTGNQQVLVKERLEVEILFWRSL